MLQLSLVHFGYSPLKGTRHIPQAVPALGPSGLGFNRRWGLVAPETGSVLRTAAHPELVRVKSRIESGNGQISLTLQIPGQGNFAVQPLGQEGARSFEFWGQHKRLSLYEHPVNTALSDFLGKPVALAYAHDQLLYGAALSLLGTATLQEIERQANAAGIIHGAGRLRDRFRSNLVVHTDQPFIEETWEGQPLLLQATCPEIPAELGGVCLTAGKPIGRCSVLDTHPSTGVRDLKLLKNLATYRPRNARGEPVAGIYASLR